MLLCWHQATGKTQPRTPIEELQLYHSDLQGQVCQFGAGEPVDAPEIKHHVVQRGTQHVPGITSAKPRCTKDEKGMPDVPEATRAGLSSLNLPCPASR